MSSSWALETNRPFSATLNVSRAAMPRDAKPSSTPPGSTKRHWYWTAENERTLLSTWIVISKRTVVDGMSPSHWTGAAVASMVTPGMVGCIGRAEANVEANASVSVTAPMASARMAVSIFSACFQSRRCARQGRSIHVNSRLTMALLGPCRSDFYGVQTKVRCATRKGYKLRLQGTEGTFGGSDIRAIAGIGAQSRNSDSSPSDLARS